MARSSGRSRSAITGRYVKPATAARHPRTTVTESGSNKGSGTHHRSAISGRYVTESTVKRSPGTTVTENG